MTIDFYYVPGSAPCRSVLLVAKSLGLDLNLKITDLMKGEQMTPEFLKMNPQHTVPTLNDNGFSLWESRAILTYLVDQYGKDDSLNPKDPKKRAIVNQRLYFDIGTLYQRFADYYYPHYFAGEPLVPARLDKIKDAFAFLNTFLDGEEWVAGPNLTIADLALVATVSTYDGVGFPVSDYPNVNKWFNKAKAEIPGYEVNQQGVEAFKHLVETLTKK